MEFHPNLSYTQTWLWTASNDFAIGGEITPWYLRLCWRTGCSVHSWGTRIPHNVRWRRRWVLRWRRDIRLPWRIFTRKQWVRNRLYYGLEILLNNFWWPTPSPSLRRSQQLTYWSLSPKPAKGTHKLCQGFWLSVLRHYRWRSETSHWFVSGCTGCFFST